MERCEGVGLTCDFLRQDRISAKNGTHVGDAQLCRQMVAQALEVEPAALQIDRFDRSPSKLTLRSRGQVKAKRFFAKTYLVDSYPIESRFVAAWDLGEPREEARRPVEKQIEVEWSMTRRMGELAGCMEVPQPIGKSAAARTIVWEEAAGRRVDRMVRRSAWADPRGKSIVPVVSRAGAWLARVHRASAGERRTLDLAQVRSSLHRLLHERGLDASRYGVVARRVFEDALAEVGSTVLEVPIVFTHGDFNNANLIWDEETQRLGVVDFELAGYQDIPRDLVTFLFNLRIQMLNPLISPTLVRALEDAFWEGYGAVPRPLYAFVTGVTAASVFYYYLPRVANRRRRRGRWAGLMASLYKTLFESSVVTRRLGIPRELWEGN
ncbi:MAG: aminoglycoside phosphotransferase family protein [Terriglobia bacterium]